MTPKKARKESKESTATATPNGATTDASNSAVAAAASAPVAPTDGSVVVREATAPKLNGRGVTYQLGRKPDADGTLRPVIRLVRNDGGGTFSKEWVALESLRVAMPPEAMKGQPFRPGGLASAFVGRSNNNPGFVACALVGEGLVARTTDKEGWFVVAADWAEYERAVMAAAPLPVGTFTDVKPPQERKKKVEPEDDTESGGANAGGVTSDAAPVAPVAEPVAPDDAGRVAATESENPDEPFQETDPDPEGDPDGEDGSPGSEPTGMPTVEDPSDPTDPPDPSDSSDLSDPSDDAAANADSPEPQVENAPRGRRKTRPTA